MRTALPIAPPSHVRRCKHGVAWVGVSALLTAGLSVSLGPSTQAQPPAPATEVTAAAVDVLPSYERTLTTQLDASKSYATVKHLVEEIGPRLNGTPAERKAAEYLRDLLEPYGYRVAVQSWGPVSTKRTADIVSTGAPLPGNPKWQMTASPAGVFTGDAAVTGDVVSVGTGQTATDFANAAGKIAFATVSFVTTPADAAAAAAAERANAISLAEANEAVAIILAPAVPATGKTSPRTVTVPTGTPVATIPVLGAGSDHTGWINSALSAGPMSLRLVTNEYVDPMGTNVIATRYAKGDPQGTTAPIVMVGAHIDSVLGAPGGHDDASGNGVSTEIARVLATMPYDKEIRIGGFGGEEAGLRGARAYVSTLTAAEKARFVGEWQMDMVGTTYEPAKLWALTPDGKSNFVVEEAYQAAERDGFDGLQNCKLGQSDHQAFFDVGIPSALFIWLNYTNPVAPATCESISRGSYQTEPEYHQPSDTMTNVSEPRLQITLDVIGGAVIENVLNQLDVTVTTDTGAPLASAPVTVDCGDGPHDAGITDAAGLTTTHVPAGPCMLSSTNGTATVTKTITPNGDADAALILDTTAPSIDLVRPADGATYASGSDVTALYFCSDSAGATTCTAPLRSGENLDTTTPGAYSFTVTSVDASGNTTTKTVRYRITGAPTATVSATAQHSRYGEVPLVQVSVGPAGLSPTGSVEIRKGNKVLASASGAPGTRSVSLPARVLRPGSHLLKVRYLDADGKQRAIANVRVVVTKATSTLEVSAVAASATRAGSLTGTISIRPRSVASETGGQVEVRAGGKVVGKGRVVGGPFDIDLKPLRSHGKVVLVLKYAGNAVIKGAKTKTKVKVG